MRKVKSLVTDAVAAGATTLIGGGNPGGDGYFYEATVLSGVPGSAAILSEEVFGPVAPLPTFETEAEAVALANATPFGSSGTSSRAISTGPCGSPSRWRPACWASTPA